MAKKKTAETSTPAAAPKPAPRRRTTAKSTPAAPAAPSVAADRVASMPEPAGERVTPADSTLSDSVTFVTVVEGPTFDQIAEAAYLRYLSRGGSDGLDFDDWIEAERALRRRY